MYTTRMMLTRTWPFVGTCWNMLELGTKAIMTSTTAPK